jgi:hypothetical protein
MKFKQFLFETPIIYDDSDINQKINNIDKKSNTKWGIQPPYDISIVALSSWVKKNIDNNILQDKILGMGSTKTVKFNDKNTVFKYNTDTKNGNQITNEIRLYKKNYAEYSDILAKFYAYGKNWCIQEKLKKILTANRFNKLFNSNIFPYWKDCQFTLYQIQKDNKTLPLKEILKDEKLPKEFNIIFKNKNLYKIIKFYFENNLNMLDLSLCNLGIDKNNHLKILDFGFFVNNQEHTSREF